MAIGSTSSAEDVTARWIRWFIPSIGDLLFVAFLILLTLTNLSSRLLGDAGIGWHIRTGQLILGTHAVPRVDPFSSSLSGHPWFAWEWLYDVVVGWLESATGLNGVVTLTALIIAITFSWTFRLMLRRGTNVLIALLLVLIAVSASMIHFFARPHVVSWLLSVAWFWILESWERGVALSLVEPAVPVEVVPETRSEITKSRNLIVWLLPLLMLAWVNLHGGFLIGFLLLAIYWLSAAWQWLSLTRSTSMRFDDFLNRMRAARRIRTLSLAAICCAVATLLNPYGYKLHVHIYRYLTNRFLMDHIDEFQSPNFHYVAQKCFAGLLLLTLIAFAVKGRDAVRGNLTHGLVVLFAVYSGLYASRNIPVSSLLLILLIGPWLTDAIARPDRSQEQRRAFVLSHFFRRMQTVEFGLRGFLWPATATLLVCWIVVHNGKLGDAVLLNTQFDAKRFPVAAVNYLAKNELQALRLADGRLSGPGLSPDYWGGYLIYRMYPQIKVVVDDRHDFYGEEYLKSYLNMMHLSPTWNDFLQEHPAQFLLLPSNSAPANILRETASWRAIYSDDVAVIFVKAPMDRQ